MTRHRFRFAYCSCALALALALFCAGSAFAQTADALSDGTPRRFVNATRLADAEQITLDGRLDEPVWSRALPAKDFIQIDPRNGEPATEPTEVRIAFSANAFYMGVTCFDSDPNGWLGYQRRRDEFLGSDDRFMWRIDTFLDERSGYFFEMNPSGLMADAVFGVNGMNRAWDGIWNARVRRSDIGWTIEIEIPFRTLNFNPDSDRWGINFQRTVRRKNEDSIWMGWARNQGLERMTNAGHVRGIREVTQGNGLDLKPYGLLTSETSPGRGVPAIDHDTNAGVDFFYNPTPGLRANLTINTDFAQTEVDQRQVNLTRFSLFFPERRDFFLDGATFFDFASTSGNGNGSEQVQPFFSRRIGLGADASPQRIDYGTKFTGQVGGQDVGFLHVRTADEEASGLVGEEFTAARVKRRVLQQSYVGGLYTRRDSRIDGAGPSHTAGLDFRLATARFRGNQNLSLAGWYVQASGPRAPEAGHFSGHRALGLSIDYPNDRWSGGFNAREVQAGFNPTVGFVTRRDYRRFNQYVGFGPRPRNHPFIRRVQFNGNVEVITNPRGHLLERNVGLTLMQMQFHSQDSFSIEASQGYELLDAPFPISPGITLPLGGEYSMTRLSVGGQTANRRMLALGARFETGGFYSGSRNQMVAMLTLRARPGYIVSFNGEWNQVDLAEGSFASNVYRLVADSQFTPFVALVNNVQFDTVSRVMGWQSRFRWILTPGNDLYLVYTHNWLEDPLADRFTTLDRRAASKVLYTHRF
jgi:hypothetical protein